ncbi:MAG TPA: NAD-dependent epimerase/dehydratase family protein [Planctomycetota bacterium]
MRYLVTGGAGFIGSHLCARLLEDGHEAIALDDLSTGAAANVEALKKNPRFELAAGTIFNATAVAGLVARADAIVHLAASVGVFQIVESPVRTIETNVRGAEIVLRAAAKRGCPVLLASTSEVYGKSAHVPFSEDDDCVLGPSSKSRWAYAASKLVDEFLALSYGKERGLPTIIARLFNTVGPRQSGRYGMVLPRFVRQALDGGPLTVFGDGAQSRCFAWVGDVVEGLIRLLREPKAVGQVFNVGNDEEITIAALADLVRQRVNPALAVEKIPYDRAYEAGFEDMRRRVPDLRKIRSLVGYAPTLGIREIVDRVIEHERRLGSPKGT